MAIIIFGINIKQHYKYTQVNNLADVSIQGRHFIRTLQVFQPPQRETSDTGEMALISCSPITSSPVYMYNIVK